MPTLEPTHDPPERAFDWREDSIKRNGLTIVPPQSEPGSDTVEFQNTRLYENEFGFITSGTRSFLDRVGDKRLDIPDYYADFNDWTPYVGHVSVRDNRYGLGISQERFEAAIRLATGGGHYSSDALTATGCGGYGVVIQSSDGDFFVTSEPIREKPEGFSAPSKMVEGIIIEEEDTEILLGIPSFIDDAEVYFDTVITGHSHAGKGRHYFETESGEVAIIDGNDLARYASVMQVADDAIGEYTYERLNAEYSCTLGSVEYRLGDALPNCEGVCVGYNLCWDDPWDTSYATLTDTIQAKAEYFSLSQTRTNDGLEFGLGSVSNSIAEFDPEKATDAPSSNPI